MVEYIYEETADFDGVTIEPDEVGICTITQMVVKSNDYCSCGERRKDNG